MEVTIEWLDKQIAELRQTEAKLLANANACNGAANAYTSVRERLLEESETAVEVTA